MVFAYPTNFTPKHGPWGYTRYASYKDWLRDEFAFRCVYCLTRERWYPTGHRNFAVEHIAPKVSNKHLKTVYDNLAYSCHLCNSRKGTRVTLNPRVNPFGTHLSVQADGRISGLTPAGNKMIALLGLDEDDLTALRKRFLDIYAAFHAPVYSGNLFVQEVFTDAFRYPTALPDLKAKNPPGNKRKRAVNRCAYQRMRGKTKPETYFD